MPAAMPALASARSTSTRGEFDATAIGIAGRAKARDQLQSARARRGVVGHLLEHEHRQLDDQRGPAPGLIEHLLELRGARLRRVAEQRALVLDRELEPAPREERALGARPGLLRVEQEAVVVEDHRVAAAAVLARVHAPELYARPKRPSTSRRTWRASGIRISSTTRM